MISISDLCFSYPDRTGIFEGFSWQVEKGSSWSVLGHSGRGKTTLMLLIAGLIRPGSGKIAINGSNLLRSRPETGLIMQDHGLLPWLTVEDNVRLGFRIRKFYGPDGKHVPVSYKSDQGSENRAVEYWLDMLSISALRDKYPSRLSGGQKQRTAVARTMVLNPDLLLMDEPFASLDVGTRESLQDLIMDMDAGSGRTRIIVTHNLEEAVYMGRSILVLGPPGRRPQIFRNPESGTREYRNSRGFADVCSGLRSVMESLK